MAININKIYLQLIRFRFDPFYEYARFFEESLQKGKENVSEKYEEAIKATDPNAEYYYVLQESYGEDHQMITETFTHNFRSFLLTQIYSAVEVEFVNLCKKIDSLRDNPLQKPGILWAILAFFKIRFSRNTPAPPLPSGRMLLEMQKSF